MTETNIKRQTFPLNQALELVLPQVIEQQLQITCVQFDFLGGQEKLTHLHDSLGRLLQNIHQKNHLEDLQHQVITLSCCIAASNSQTQNFSDWTVQRKDECTCISQGLFFGPQNDASFELSVRQEPTKFVEDDSVCRTKVTFLNVVM